MAGSIVILTILSYIFFYLIGMNYLPKYFLITPALFILLTVVLHFFVNNYLKKDKELSVASIIGIRGILIVPVVLILVINMLIDKAHILPLTIAYVVYDIVFSIFETRILLMLNKKD